jgi:hypothetical protein
MLAWLPVSAHWPSFTEMIVLNLAPHRTRPPHGESKAFQLTLADTKCYNPPHKCLSRIKDEASWSIPRKFSGVTFISNEQTPEVLQPGKQALDFPPSSVSLQPTSILSPIPSVPAMWSNKFNSVKPQFCV